ncbi:tyrosine-protein phosphatase [Pararhodobacter zhoushanensis]|uniref:tyrosine-protein phosphatase n=1 Tax=Pararhodobacter zhoushanensis TaxID=2479545 RepID=UPI000F8E1940|nr:tyrosine-protein phosphatase [Pararhodobacter zhoushanensis]
MQTTNATNDWDPVFNGSHPNFRVMKGISADGRKVRRGAFLRGPALHDLTEDQWRTLLAERDLALVVDFRRADEVSERPNRLPQDLHHHAVALPIDSGASAKLAQAIEAANYERAASAMRGAYAGFASLHLPVYADFLRHLASASGRGVFFHCTAGKDRTGFAAALILLALGVPREQVMADFLATGTLWRPDASLLSRVPETAHAAIFGIEAAYLDAALDELKRTQSSAEAFAARAMGGEKPFQAWVEQSLT